MQNRGLISRRNFLKGMVGTLALFNLSLVLSSCKVKDENKSSENEVIKNEPTPTIEVDPVIEDPIDLVSMDSINLLVNKSHPLKEDYVPSNLVHPNVLCKKDGIELKEEAALAIEELFEAAKNAGYPLAIGSAYRSYNYQKTLYNNYVARDGEAAANRYSAKPGESEHQTGLAVDLANENGDCYLKSCFKDTEEGIWLKENAYLYGFILRYPEEKEEITGYIFEPWHYRFIGKKEALKVYQSGLTLEEYYEILD